MEFKYKLSVMECFACGVRNVCRRLFLKSKALRTAVMILAGSLILMNVIRVAESGRIHAVGVISTVLMLAAFVFVVLLIRIPDEVRQLYRQWGKEPRFVRRLPLMETFWGWPDVGYLMETDVFFHFFTKEQRLMLYMEKELLGDWKAQKLFVQDCQAKGIQYQVVYPEIIRAVQGKDKEHPKADVGKSSGRRGRKQISDTQEGWRKFWAEKEKERGGTERLRVAVTVLAVIGIFLLAIFLPEFERSPGLGVYPEAYENYTPLAEQVEVLEKLGFTVPQEIVDEMNTNMKEWPESRGWVEGHPYTGLLSAIGMPERSSETWETTGYSEQVYWFDWEGFDMSSEYVNILNGVNAMAGGAFTITDAEQDMSDVNWEQGTGDVGLRFCIDGKPYEYRLELMNDWLDTNIVNYINDALKKAGVEKRVYAMGDDGQGCILFCRDEEWAKRFRKATGIRLETE